MVSSGSVAVAAIAIAIQSTIFRCNAEWRRQFEIYCFKRSFDWHFIGHVVVQLLSCGALCDAVPCLRPCVRCSITEIIYRLSSLLRDTNGLIMMHAKSLIHTINLIKLICVCYFELHSSTERKHDSERSYDAYLNRDEYKLNGCADGTVHNSFLAPSTRTN